MQKRCSLREIGVWLGVGVCLVSGCGGGPAGSPAAPVAEAPSRIAEEPAPVPLRNTGWERLRLEVALLEIELPEAQAWRASASRVWTRLEHPATGSVLEIQGARAGRLVRPADCERRARLEKPELPKLPDFDEALERRKIAAPPGFLTEISVSVAETKEGALEGRVLGFGAKTGRCLSLYFTTSARGSGRETEVARRLGLFVERVLPSLTEVDVEARVRPEPFGR